MEENKYRVIDCIGNVIADNMALETALMLMKAYCETYSMQKIELKLEECDRCESNAD